MKVYIGPYIDNPEEDPEKNREINIQIDNYDTWNMDSTLAFIIVPMLKQLKETKHGSPHVEDEDVPENLRSYHAPGKDEGDADDFWPDRWEWVMNEMIWAFEQHLIDWEDQYYHEDGEWHTEPLEDEPGMSKLVWDKKPVIDMDGMRKHSERIQNGFRLFGTYYSGLWD